MVTELVIGIVGSLIASIIIWLYHRMKNQSVNELMKQLVSPKLTKKESQEILKKMNLKLGMKIKLEYIRNFVPGETKIEKAFLDICEKNDIEPTKEICIKFLGYDSSATRDKYYKLKANPTVPTPVEILQNKKPVNTNNKQVVYMSELLKERYPETCGNLIKILEKHNTNYAFIKGTKDIWCRDYMPVQTESGKLIQFRYGPSYLKGKKEWEESRSDVKEICRLNNLDVTFTDINLDGGNVLICDGRAIISDRLFSENPERDRDSLIKELSNLLECEIIIIPALKSQEEDLTGHADGMVRFVDKNTIIGNERRPDEYKYMKDGLQKALDTFNLTYIDIPYFVDKDAKHPYSAIGIYVNYLEVNDLIVVPIFNSKEDQVAIDVIKKAFPNKTIETINYNDVAKEGGLLNCTTWTYKR